MVMLQLVAGSFHIKQLCSRLYSIKVEFYLRKQKHRFWATLWGLTGNVRTPSIARWTAYVDFLFVIIKLFRYLLRLRRYKRKSVEVGVFTLSTNFRRKEVSHAHHCWCQKARMIALSCGMKISAEYCLVLSQSTRVLDRRTDRRTELRQLIPR